MSSGHISVLTTEIECNPPLRFLRKWNNEHFGSTEQSRMRVLWEYPRPILGRQRNSSDMPRCVNSGLPRP